MQTGGKLRRDRHIVFKGDSEIPPNNPKKPFPVSYEEWPHEPEPCPFRFQYFLCNRRSLRGEPLFGGITGSDIHQSKYQKTQND